MKKYLTLLLLSIILLSCVAQEMLEEKDLYGGYSEIEGSGFYAEFSLEQDGKFYSWRHQQPEMSGSWSLKDNVIYFKNDSAPSFDNQAKIIKINEKFLTLYYIEDDLTVKYERID